MLALSGTARAHLNKSGQSRELSVVKLYSPYGVLLRTLKVWRVVCCCFPFTLHYLTEGDPLRLALCVFWRG